MRVSAGAGGVAGGGGARARARAVGVGAGCLVVDAECVDPHSNFPYSVFLGSGGAQVTMPQMYWRLFGSGVGGVFARTRVQNAVYGRPIAPLGQAWAPAPRAEVRRFRAQAAAHGAHGVGGGSGSTRRLRTGPASRTRS